MSKKRKKNKNADYWLAKVRELQLRKNGVNEKTDKPKKKKYQGKKKKVVKKVDKKAEPKSVQPKKEEVQKVEEPKQIKASIEKTEDAYIPSTGFIMNIEFEVPVAFSSRTAASIVKFESSPPNAGLDRL